MLMNIFERKTFKFHQKLNRYKALVDQAAHLKNNGNHNLGVKKGTDQNLKDYLKSREPPPPPPPKEPPDP